MPSGLRQPPSFQIFIPPPLLHAEVPHKRRSRRQGWLRTAQPGQQGKVSWSRLPSANHEKEGVGIVSSAKQAPHPVHVRSDPVASHQAGRPEPAGGATAEQVNAAASALLGGKEGQLPAEKKPQRPPLHDSISWTDTFIRSVAQKEADLTRQLHAHPAATGIDEPALDSPLDELQQQGPPCSLGTTAVGIALRAPSHDEGVHVLVDPTEAYRSGTPAEEAITAALRAVSDEPDEPDLSDVCSPGKRLEDSDSWPRPPCSDAPEEGIVDGSARVKFVSAKDVMASTQFQQTSTVRLGGPPTGAHREPLQPIASQSSLAPIHRDADRDRILCQSKGRSSTVKFVDTQTQSYSAESWGSHSYPSLNQSSSSSEPLGRGQQRRQGSPASPPQSLSQDSQSNSYDAALHASHLNHGLQSVRTSAERSVVAVPPRRTRSTPDALGALRDGSCAAPARLRSGLDRSISEPQSASVRGETVAGRKRNADHLSSPGAADQVPLLRATHRQHPDVAERLESRSGREANLSIVGTSGLGSVSREPGRPAKSKFVVLGPSSATPREQATAQTTPKVSNNATSNRSGLVFVQPRPDRSGASIENREGSAQLSGRAAHSRTGIVTKVGNGSVHSLHSRHRKTASEPHAPPTRPTVTSGDDSNIKRQRSAYEVAAAGQPSAENESFLDSLGEESSAAAGTADIQSIPPPPALRFDPSSLTLISRLLARPELYLSARQGGPPGQISAARFHVLALVRNVGPLEEVFVRVYRNGKREEGRLEPSFRSSLVLQDGRDGSLLKVMLWGETARVWAGSEADISVTAGASRDETTNAIDVSADATSLGEGFTTLLRRGGRPLGIGASKHAGRKSGKAESRLDCGMRQPMREGDVICLSNIVLNRSQRRDTVDAEDSRPGCGAAEDIELQGTASPRTASHAELCWRWDTRSSAEAQRYKFDPEVAAFDRRCKDVWRCAAWWQRGRTIGTAGARLP
ncbi:unnamed protein product [Parajaminaea phylloscopi]